MRKHVEKYTQNLQAALLDLLSEEVARSVLPAVKGATDNLHEYVVKIVEKQVPHSIGYWLDKNWWAPSRAVSVERVVREAAEKILRERLSPDFVEEVVNKAADDLQGTLYDRIERDLGDEILRRAFPQEEYPRGRVKRLLRGAARSLLESNGGDGE